MGESVVTLATDSEADVFGIYVDGRLVYDYDLSNVDEVIRSVAEALGATYKELHFIVSDTYVVPSKMEELKLV